MDAARRKSGATYADIEALPDHVIGEIVDGDLYVSPRPASRHALAASTLGHELGGPFQRGRGGPGGWWIVDEPELHLAKDVLVPDLAGWRRERMSIFPDAAFFTLAPDWVCEVLSPSTENLDRVRKMRKYAVAGVKHAWLLDPIRRRLEIYRIHGEHWLLVAAHEESERVRAEPFDAIEIELSVLWGEEPVPR
ncbi:MAG: Uma2 family endonuclease [Myxococcales bacterium]